jgi:hypothetical protein
MAIYPDRGDSSRPRNAPELPFSLAEVTSLAAHALRAIPAAAVLPAPVAFGYLNFATVRA